MERFRLTLFLALVTALLPFIGLPYLYLMWAYPILGVLILLSGIRRKRAVTASHEQEPLT